MLLVTLREPIVIPDPSTHDELDDLRTGLEPHEAYWWAINSGWRESQAGNLAAWYAGIPVVDGEESPLTAWSLRTVERLIFVRWLLATARIGSAVDGGTTPWWYLVGARRPTWPSRRG